MTALGVGVSGCEVLLALSDTTTLASPPSADITRRSRAASTPHTEASLTIFTAGPGAGFGSARTVPEIVPAAQAGPARHQVSASAAALIRPPAVWRPG